MKWSTAKPRAFLYHLPSAERRNSINNMSEERRQEGIHPADAGQEREKGAGAAAGRTNAHNAATPAEKDRDGATSGYSVEARHTGVDDLLVVLQPFEPQPLHETPAIGSKSARSRSKETRAWKHNKLKCSANARRRQHKSDGSKVEIRQRMARTPTDISATRSSSATSGPISSASDGCCENQGGNSIRHHMQGLSWHTEREHTQLAKQCHLQELKRSNRHEATAPSTGEADCKDRRTT
jgi:hypothetical protein